MRRTFISGFICLAVFLLLPQAWAQHEGHPGQAVIGYVPGEILKRPVKIWPGIGVVHEPVTTSSPEAQGFYDRPGRLESSALPAGINCGHRAGSGRLEPGRVHRAADA